MAEYKDVELLRKQIAEFKMLVESSENSDYLKGYITGIDAVMEAIDELPAADVQEVKHGRWITSEITTDSGYTSCSCCHSEYYIGDLQNLEGDNDFVMYCPNCGARMDGE